MAQNVSPNTNDDNKERIFIDSNLGIRIILNYWTLDKFMVISWLWGESKMASKAHHKRILMDYGFSQRRSWSIIREFERITDFLKLRSYSHNLPSNHFLSQRSEIASGSGTLGSDLLLPFRWSFCPKSNSSSAESFNIPRPSGTGTRGRLPLSTTGRQPTRGNVLESDCLISQINLGCKLSRDWLLSICWWNTLWNFHHDC